MKNDWIAMKDTSHTMANKLLYNAIIMFICKVTTNGNINVKQKSHHKSYIQYYYENYHNVPEIRLMETTYCIVLPILLNSTPGAQIDIALSKDSLVT